MVDTLRNRPAASDEPAAVQALKQTLRGDLLQPGDPDYDPARKVWNGMYDRRPAYIARCAGAADVIAALRFAQDEGLPVAVRGGGHSVAGKSTCDNGLVIDLTKMRSVRVDPVRRTARTEAGVLLGELDCGTQAFGLATTAGTVSDTGIAGLTLGGGLGWLMGKYGRTCDNLLSADVVTADGRLLIASVEENADLFWGPRGGGGNFGIVTSFEYPLHPVGPLVLGGMILHPIDQARDVLRFYREFTEGAPDEMTLYAALLTSPEGMPVIGLLGCYAGPLDEGEQVTAPLHAFGTPIMGQFGPLPYTVQQTILDAGFGHGQQYYMKSQSISRLGDEVIDAVVESFARVPSPFSAIAIGHRHGAMARVAPEATAFTNRTVGYDVEVFGVWHDPSQTETIDWVRATYEAIRPNSDGAVYVNALDVDDGDRVRQTYGKNYERLVELKKKYDPNNVFRSNQNIAPA